MNKYRLKQSALLILLLLSGLVAVPMILAWPHIRQDQFNHALLDAVERQDAVAVKSLLQQGADPNFSETWREHLPIWQQFWERLRTVPAPPPRSGDCALMQAIYWNQSNGSPAFAEIIQALVHGGANVNVQDDGGVTPLMQEALALNPITVKILLKAGANANALDHSGMPALYYLLDPLQPGDGGRYNPRPTPHDIAHERKIVQRLLRYGARVNKHTLDWTSDAQCIQMLKQAGAK